MLAATAGAWVSGACASPPEPVALPAPEARPKAEAPTGQPAKPTLQRLTVHLALVAPLPDGGVEPRDVGGGIPVRLGPGERLLVSARAEPQAHLWLLHRPSAGDFEVVGHAESGAVQALLAGLPGWPQTPLPTGISTLLVLAATAPPAELKGRTGRIHCGAPGPSPDAACASLQLAWAAAQATEQDSAGRLPSASVRTAEGRGFPGVLARISGSGALTAVRFDLVQAGATAP